MPTVIEPRETQPLPLPCDAEVLAEARKICRARLMADRNRPREMRLLGLLVAREGQSTLAVDCLASAVEMDPSQAEYWTDYASALAKVGRHAEAVDACQRALALDPGQPDIWLQIGKSLRAQKLFAEAAAIYERHLLERPDDRQTRMELGDLHRQQGATAEALACYEACLEGRVAAEIAVAAYARIGQLHLASSAWAGAIAAFAAALEVDEQRADLHAGTGQALMGLGRFEEAVAAFRESLNVEPFSHPVTSQLVMALELLGRPHDACRAWLHLGTVLQGGEALPEAVAALRQALARKADCLDALIRLSATYLSVGEPAAAIAPSRAALDIDPLHIGVHFQLGCALQLTGAWDEGWDELAWLCDQRRIKRWRAFEQPRWDGSSLEGKSILFWAGQDYGLGDTIHLVRFARHLKRLGARLVVECQPLLASLIERMPDVDVTVPRGAPLAAFDVHAPMMWVPCVDRTARQLRADDAPYLSVDEPLRARWGELLAPTTARRVGLCWGGQSTRKDASWRFTSLSTFAPLGEVANVHFVSLQLPPQSDELFCPPAGLQVEAHLDESRTVYETAALMCNLDLIITVDTMVANLAGALGRPVWTLLPCAADWKWLQNERDTVWYPSMRLFRQRQRGDWTGVIEEVKSALTTWAAPQE